MTRSGGGFRPEIRRAGKNGGGDERLGGGECGERRNRREGRGELETEPAEEVAEKFAGMRLVGKLGQGWRVRFLEGKFGGRRMDGRARGGGEGTLG